MVWSQEGEPLTRHDLTQFTAIPHLMVTFRNSTQRNVPTRANTAEACMRRYWHADAIVSLAFSRQSLQLASGSASELGIWSPVTRNVTKQKVLRTRIGCA